MKNVTSLYQHCRVCNTFFCAWDSICICVHMWQYGSRSCAVYVELMVLSNTPYSTLTVCVCVQRWLRKVKNFNMSVTQLHVSRVSEHTAPLRDWTHVPLLSGSSALGSFRVQTRTWGSKKSSVRAHVIKEDNELVLRQSTHVQHTVVYMAGQLTRKRNWSP